MEKIILASASPRRRDLLARLGIEFAVHESGVDEAKLMLSGTPETQVIVSALAKAEKIAERYPDRWTLGADTIVVLDDEIYGKPKDRADAIRMLRQLTGNEHRVYTGLALVRFRALNGLWDKLTDWECTKVRMGSLTIREIEAYVDSGEPLDKAGAYGIQERGAFLIQSIEGCYFNVVGLPLRKTGLLLIKAGIPIWMGDLI